MSYAEGVAFRSAEYALEDGMLCCNVFVMSVWGIMHKYDCETGKSDIFQRAREVLIGKLEARCWVSTEVSKNHEFTARGADKEQLATLRCCYCRPVKARLLKRAPDESWIHNKSVAD